MLPGQLSSHVSGAVGPGLSRQPAQAPNPFSSCCCMAGINGSATGTRWTPSRVQCVQLHTVIGMPAGAAVAEYGAFD